MLYRRRRSKFSELVPNPFAKRSCNKICSNQIRGIARGSFKSKHNMIDLDFKFILKLFCGNRQH